MLDPQLIISQARQGPIPSTWKIFSAKRSRIDGFFDGTLHDPDPLLIFTEEAVITYLSEKKPLAIIEFANITHAILNARGSYMAAAADPVVWIDLYYSNKKKVTWSASNLWEWNLNLKLEIIQYFIEAHALYKAFHTTRTIEDDSTSHTKDTIS